MSDDDDKTVFGQPLPSPASNASRGRSGSGNSPAPDKTRFGQQPQAPNHNRQVRSAPVGNSPPPSQTWQRPTEEDTWVGGALNPQPGPPPPRQNYGGHAPNVQPIYRPGTGRRADGAEIFPEIPREQQPDPMRHRPKIALSDALKATGLGKGASSNPLVAAAANLLILFGRLRTGLVEMQAGPLIDHVTREIDDFERNALASNISSEDARDAKYALCATADDIVQNLPGADRGMWLEYSMIARFFGERSSGVGFFQKMDDAMKAPGQRYNLLELMLICLSLGFEGQYRSMPNGPVELSRIRMAIYETLRRVHPRPDDDIAVNWTGVPLGGKRRRGGVPIWVVASLGALMIVALFATFSTLLSRESVRVQTRVLALHSGIPAITIERTEPIKRYAAPNSTVLVDISQKIDGMPSGDQIVVEQVNDWVFIRVADFLLFKSASADLRPEFSDLAQQIGQMLEEKKGPIRVVGHTDSLPLSGRGRYKTNEQLSIARAQAVADVLSQNITEKTRISVEGKGATDPVADNKTREGRARNRRVDIMIPSGQ